jgi:hypothetical protein
MGRVSTIRRRADPQALRASWWTFCAVRSVRRQLRSGRLEDVVLAPPPSLSDPAGRGVDAALRRMAASCLERSLVLQRWLATHGERRDVVIGVRAPSTGFRAHAWLDGEPAGDFDELLRLSP